MPPWWALIVGRVAAAGTFVDLYGLILSGRRVVGAGDLDRADGVSAVQAAAIGAGVARVLHASSLPFRKKVDLPGGSARVRVVGAEDPLPGG